MVTTRYGRHAAPRHFGAHVVTEIKAVALGANCLYPEVESVLDMSGQDTKAVLLNDQREVTDFEMNDKCAAGTGKFLEVMAASDVCLRPPELLLGPILKISPVACEDRTIVQIC